MAYFGYNKWGGNGDPKDAINAALEFRKEFEKISKGFEKFCLDNNGTIIPNIDLKCGIHNGPAYLNLFGTPRRNSLNIYGPTVNFASRLEGFADNHEIIVSSTVHNMVRNGFEFSKLLVRNRVKEGFKGFESEQFVYNVKHEK